MQSINIYKASLHLRPREQMQRSQKNSLWCVSKGVLRIDRQMADEALHFVRLALPGDILGIERIAEAAQDDIVKAITSAYLTPFTVRDDVHLASLFRDSTLCNYQRCRETASLRIGTVDERVRRLLLLVANGNDKQRDEVEVTTIPSLVNIASIINAAPETVSRIITGFRASGFLREEKRPRRGTMALVGKPQGNEQWAIT
ncbi:Crp/Fnr family transcriptional regulator [Duganella qianjiadongensis]|uniref:Helix-turn-helix domain-containing protein n=1 Tax=Duganella qianjiadongensis TaxID=2692176 RepID=A0ABW9VRM4_9BURK|nr:Crp/Fnr family transcriptional regulator [Duganella qianjiadongensis]MYM42116.1 hypothetical protein [Duganella qianjiadongensis]